MRLTVCVHCSSYAGSLWFSGQSEDMRLVISHGVIYCIYLLLLLLFELHLSVFDNRLPVSQQRYYFVKRHRTTVILGHC